MRPAAVVTRVTEADRTHNETRELLQAALVENHGGEDIWVWIRDVADGWVVFEVESPDSMDTLRQEYSISDDSAVTLTGTPEKVVAKTEYETVAESTLNEAGRVLEAKGNSPDGGRVFRVQIIQAGTSRNGIRYSESVLAAAAPMYDGAKAFDHHRTAEELQTSTIAGLVGHYREPVFTGTGVEADLCLLPSATHTAEALDASLAAQDAGKAPVVGISHDVSLKHTPAIEGGRRIREAVSIEAVLSADVVADPSAGGRVTRMVAGGSGDDNHPEEGEGMTIEELLALLNGASDEDRAKVLSELGITEEQLAALAANDPAATDGDNAPADGDEPVLAGATEGGFDRGSLQGEQIVRLALGRAKLDDRLLESITEGLPERFSEADVTAVIGNVQRVVESVEKSGLRPTVGHVDVGEEAAEKRAERMYQTLCGNFREGYTSLRQAYADITGAPTIDLLSSELPFAMVREAYAGGRVEGERVSESLDTSSWGQVLGDSITRRLIDEYNLAQLSEWRKLVSDVVPVNDFRTQRRDRIGGYGVLPEVAEAAPYQPLTSPGDEEATYAITKKGGTEDFTLEMAANDDLKGLLRIPKNLGRSAALTLYRFVIFTMLADNPTLTYDSVALFATGHVNTDTGSTLAQSTLSVGRRKMREQSRYGVDADVLGITPKYLVVPPELEELAFQLCTSAVAIPATPAGPSNTPNLHQGLEPLVIDQLTDANDWYLIGDPAVTPTIELGFFQGREEPELFVQDDPKVGAAFSSDKVTYKIRHIYSGTVLDHRAFYRGQG